MHELSLVAALVDHALEVLARERATRVLSLTLDLGVLSCADPDALAFCFPLAVRGTPLEGAHLDIRPQPLLLHCNMCNADTTRHEPELVCASCQSSAVDVLGGRDLTLATLEVQ